ncbi:Predicted dehydrogenase [Lentzea albidocapillata subsp. violacea]|uniref:Predicted dehydrogenase n=1 Tax=Lentzea albidocapillata subsp. violacea TaxID=128104 RepID=A0A1G8PQH4_9PSEU|nr:Gfo/Idh/MocA family oxidoreductase [Lentzea albidocapillata]SDI94120.1 Predicted dehydrogenase [Lentzea albidocapillata subsp. violacea]
MRRAAIVGTGGIATSHARALRAAGDRIELVAVVDVDDQRAAAFAKEWGVARVYPGVAALLAVEPLDVVHICTPPRAHVPLALECLAANVNVLVEKPPALSLSEIDMLVAAERTSTGRVATVFQHRFGPAAIRLRRMIGEGVLGRSLVAKCDTLWYRDDAYFDVPWRGSWDSEGGGPTMGHGIHQFDLMLSVLGPWQEIRALAVRQVRDVATEDVSMALVTFADGTVASVINSVLSPRETSELRFDFEHATVEVEHLYGYTDAQWTVTPAPGHDDVVTRWREEQSEIVSGHQCQMAEFLDALDSGETPPVTLADTRNTMEFIAALYASAFTGTVVKAGQIGPDSPFYATMEGIGAPWANDR